MYKKNRKLPGLPSHMVNYMVTDGAYSMAYTRQTGFGSCETMRESLLFDTKNPI